jgi:MutS domain V
MTDSSEALRDPEAEYRRRIDALRTELLPLNRRHAVFGYSKVGLLFVGPIFFIWIVTSKYISTYWVLVPILLFIFLEVLHERVVRAIDRNARATQFYERGIARINDRWAGTGEGGERFASESHPYARDLDLFGNGSLFQLLCDARTRAGEETLASWLLSPASPGEARSRNAAVVDLRDRIDLREDLAVLGANLRGGISPEVLVAWAEGKPIVASSSRRILAGVLATVWLAIFFTWISWGIVDPRSFGPMTVVVVMITVVNASFNRGNQRWHEAALRADASCKGLPLLAAVMARFEREPFSAPKLVDLKGRLQVEGERPSRSIARLARLLEFLQSNRNIVIELFDRVVFYTLQTTFAIEAWHERFGPSVRGWIAAIGELEALSSLAAYAYERPGDVFPEFSAEAPRFEAEDFTHPLIPRNRAIRNDIRLGHDLRLMIISGPNMAGKSTFLRAVGLNAVLAQCGAPVRARRLRLSALSVAASVCVLDSLQGGISRFYAEILRIKLAMDLAGGPTTVLFLLDELLGGTNSHDRRIGSESVVKNLLERGAIGMITTHDLALAEIADSLGPCAANFHFEDRVEDGQLRFDYRLSPGVVRTSNALQLMRSIGIEI